MSKQKINNTKRKFNDDDNNEDKYMNLSREDIIERCKQLEKHVEQLRNTINKTTKDKQINEKKQKINRPFDFSKHSKRHIFLKFIYLGWEYHVRECSRR